MMLHTNHVCLHVHLNICVSVNAFRFMAARHKRRPDLYFILYVRPLHGFYARQLYVQIRFILSFSSTLIYAPSSFRIAAGIQTRFSPYSMTKYALNAIPLFVTFVTLRFGFNTIVI